jgi:nuclear GTP-binding protein
MVLNDFLRGKIPWFTPPPVAEGTEENGFEKREGRLGEMAKKRKRDDESVADTSIADIASSPAGNEDENEEEFEGFDSDGGVELDDVAGDVDAAFGLDSDDDDSEIESNEHESEGVEDEQDDGLDGAAEEQLQDELLDDVEVSKQTPPKKKRQKT